MRDDDTAKALPIKLDAVSNGEFIPIPQSSVLRRVVDNARQRITYHAARKGMERREFLKTSCASATVLLGINQLVGCAGGRYALNSDSELDNAAADDVLAGSEFIFDVQTHHVSTDRPWYKQNVVMNFLADTPQADCKREHWSDCYSRDLFIKEIFLDSDTQLGVLSALAGGGEGNPLHAEEAAQTREAMARMEGSPRLRIHGIVLPNMGVFEETKEHMQRIKEELGVAAWKLYPIWGAEGTGYHLDSDIGRAHGRSL